MKIKILLIAFTLKYGCKYLDSWFKSN